ncbi:MAG: cytochrome c peroxidase [Bryobacteraceae bacterium]|nr:cytochrome c peroxidase [Bryobacteraceae bacterium]
MSAAWQVAVFLLAAADRPVIPLGLDAFLPIPEDNPMTAEKVALGRRLFFDKRLSRDGSVACATCHEPEKAFSDSRPLAIGVRGQKAARRSPRIVNRVYGKSFFWDGRAATLEEQVLGPIQNPVEMDLPIREAAARTGLGEAELRNALASYVRTILSGDSPYDRYVAGDRAALSAVAQQGLQLFRGKAGCTACHLGPNLTDEGFHNTGIGGDEGRGRITGKAGDRGAFKTPSLREVARAAPYMHDGSLLTLDDVVEHYNKGGGGKPNLDAEIRELHLTAQEKKALVEFLRSLNGTISEGLK